jgi:UDP-GlcNAc:undecaprenyl-phosphate GlcNAc-1-phosphate transferase
MSLVWAPLAAALVSTVVGWLVVRFESLHAHVSHDATASGPQKFHARPTPRIGGLPVACGLLAAVLLMAQLPGDDSSLPAGLYWFLLATLPAFLSGMVEDLTKRIGPDMRLWASFLSALCGVWFFDAVIDRIDLPLIDPLLSWYPIALLFTMVAVGGIAHAINIIDGYNGLAGMVVVAISLALGVVASLVDDQLVAIIALSLAGATAGFLYWNWPGGRLFAGDGGAYLWGTTIGLLSVLLVSRNPQVSPWFPLLVVLYPVTETLFTVYRRRFVHATPSGLPDAMHLHQLIYRRLLRCPGCRNNIDLLVRRNSATSPFLWIVAASSIVPALLAWRHTSWLLLASLLFVLFYIWLYGAIVRFSLPAWIWRQGERVTRWLHGG